MLVRVDDNKFGFLYQGHSHGIIYIYIYIYIYIIYIYNIIYMYIYIYIYICKENGVKWKTICCIVCSHTWYTYFVHVRKRVCSHMHTQQTSRKRGNNIKHCQTCLKKKRLGSQVSSPNLN
jgi:hypothetical protein